VWRDAGWGAWWGVCELFFARASRRAFVVRAAVSVGVGGVMIVLRRPECAVSCVWAVFLCGVGVVVVCCCLFVELYGGGAWLCRGRAGAAGQWWCGARCVFRCVHVLWCCVWWLCGMVCCASSVWLAAVVRLWLAVVRVCCRVQVCSAYLLSGCCRWCMGVVNVGDVGQGCRVVCRVCFFVAVWRWHGVQIEVVEFVVVCGWCWVCRFVLWGLCWQRNLSVLCSVGERRR